MPQSEGYMFLNEHSVYQTTTEPTNSHSVLDTVKQAFVQVSGSNEIKLFNQNMTTNKPNIR